MLVDFAKVIIFTLKSPPFDSNSALTNVHECTQRTSQCERRTAGNFHAISLYIWGEFACAGAQTALVRSLTHGKRYTSQDK
jgi:hypothetical protein